MKIFLAGMLLVGGSGAQGWASDSGILHGWRKIILAGRKALVMRGEVTLTLSRKPYRGPGEVGGIPPIPVVELGTETRFSFFGIRQGTARTRSTLEASTGRSLEFLNVKRGKSSKRILFREGAYRQIRRRPPERGKTVPLDRWEVFQDEERPYEFADGKPLPAGIPVHDTYSLLYLVGEADLSGPDRSVEFVVISRGKLLAVRVAEGRLRENMRKIRDLSTGKVRKLPFRERELILIPGNGDPSSPGFLSMEGEVELWVDEETRTLLEVSGKIPKVPGRTVLKIKAVEPGVT